MWKFFVVWFASEWYHFKKSEHADTWWFGMLAAPVRYRYIHKDLRQYMNFYVDRGRVEIRYRFPRVA